MNTQVQEALSVEQKRALLSHWLEQETANENPLSFAQQRLWFLDQLQPNSSVYNVPMALRITGFLNIEALKNSLETIVERHEILRTTYASVESPVQVVQDRFCVSLPIFDLSGEEEIARREILRRRLREEAAKAFNLKSDLMLRVALFRLTLKEHVLFLNVHHIAFDEWSQKIFFRELLHCYRAFCEKADPGLRPLPIQYADFASWQRDPLHHHAWIDQLKYWKEHLGTNVQLTDLPSDRSEPQERSLLGATSSRVFSRGLVHSVRSLCRKECVTPYMLLFSAFNVLLHRYTGQDEITVGTPVSGRNRVETEDLIGFFVNTLPIRTDFTGDLTFRELLLRERNTCLNAFSRQDVPFEKIVETLQPERTSARNPFFNVMFSLQNAPHNKWELPGLVFEQIEIENGTSKFDLTLAMQDGGESLGAVAEFSTDLFSPGTIERLLGHLEVVLESAVSNPEQKISKLPLLTPAEHVQILVDWNQTSTVYPREATVHKLFEKAVCKNPDAIAVRYGSDQLTYAQLNDRANRVANFLRKLGAGPDVPIGVSMERSTQMIVGWLGILKAGAAYVPLDPEYPQERLAFMIEDTKMPVILTQKALLHQFSKETRTICIDSDWRSISQEPNTSPLVDVGAENLAYIIYTSGSTGRPKGAAVPHRGIVRLVFNTNYIQFDSDDRLAQISNSSFDAATFEVWGSLLHGGQLVGVEKDIFLSPKAFAQFIHEEKITGMFLTVALFNQIVAEVPDAFRGIKNVLFGGDAADAKAVRTVLEKGAPQHLINGYGPTESTTFSSCYEVRSVHPEAKSISIGRPNSNTMYYVLDKNLQPVPVGVWGELHIGGDGLARGYFNRPELTASKFIKNPFSPDPGGRLYKTGDRVRWLPEGIIDFSGRIDCQVKIRGFRIEPEEIESILKQQSLVRDAVVLVREDSPGDKRLVAYVATPQAGATTPEQLRKILAEKVPAYMVPSTVVVMEAFPLTPNGKIDRRSLPKPENKSTTVEVEPPRSFLENQLKRIWADVLERKSVGVDENFFELGGHSLLAVKLFAQVEKQLGHRVPLQILFQAPTIEQLAKIMREKGWSPAGSSLVEIKNGGEKPPIFWLHTLGGGGGGGLFTYQQLANLLGPDQPSFGFVAPTEPHANIETMASHYIKELKGIQPKGPYYLGGYCFGGVIAYEMARQLAGNGEKLALIALIESMPPQLETASPWSAISLHHMLKTLPAWIAHTASNRTELVERLSAKAKKLKRKLWGNNQANVKTASVPDLNTFIDMSNYPKEFRRYAEIHWDAFSKYVPQPFAGKVTLFRTRQPRLLTLDPEVSWRKLARGGVDVRILPGKHETILHAPFVHRLAEEVRSCLQSTATAV